MSSPLASRVALRFAGSNWIGITYITTPNQPDSTIIRRAASLLRVTCFPCQWLLAADFMAQDLDNEADGLTFSES